MASEFA
jgi:hypothetical protein